MSKLTEWAKLAWRGLPNIDKIVEGVINDNNFNSLSDSEKQEIIRRRAICETCPLNSINAKTSPEYMALMHKNYDQKREDFSCGICGCPISTRTASLSSNCGLEFYNQNNPNNIQNLKWQKYENR